MLHTHSVINSPKVSEECQEYKLDFLEARICLQQMLNACFLLCQPETWRVQARKDDGLLGLVTLWLQHGTLALVVLCLWSLCDCWRIRVTVKLQSAKWLTLSNGIHFGKLDRLCGLVVRVSGYRYRGPGFDSRRYQIFWVVVGLERGPLSLVRSIEELLE